MLFKVFEVLIDKLPQKHQHPRVILVVVTGGLTRQLGPSDCIAHPQSCKLCPMYLIVDVLDLAMACPRCTSMSLSWMDRTVITRESLTSTKGEIRLRLPVICGLISGEEMPTFEKPVRGTHSRDAGV
jgi:hypothetical protein